MTGEQNATWLNNTLLEQMPKLIENNRLFIHTSFQSNDALNDVDVHDPTRNRMDAPLKLPYALASTRLAYFVFQAPDLRALAVSKRRGRYYNLFHGSKMLWLLSSMTPSSVSVPLDCPLLSLSLLFCLCYHPYDVTGVWSVHSRLCEEVNAAFRAHDFVIIYFLVRALKGMYGVARMG